MDERGWSHGGRKLHLLRGRLLVFVRIILSHEVTLHTGFREIEFFFEEIRYEAEAGDEATKDRAHDVEVCDG
jgi:hypothetical protein